MCLNFSTTLLLLLLKMANLVSGECYWVHLVIYSSPRCQPRCVKVLFSNREGRQVSANYWGVHTSRKFFLDIMLDLVCSAEMHWILYAVADAPHFSLSLSSTCLWKPAWTKSLKSPAQLWWVYLSLPPSLPASLSLPPCLPPLYYQNNPVAFILHCMRCITAENELQITPLLTHCEITV